MSFPGPSRGANRPLRGTGQRREPQAWGDHTSVRARRVFGNCSRRRRIAVRLSCCAIIVVAGASIARANAVDPRVRLYDGPDGATCRYFNAGARIAWRHPAGDWLDAGGREQGDRPFAAARLDRTGAGEIVQLDVTTLVRQWSKDVAATGALLVGSTGSAAAFASRESTDGAWRPRLRIAYDDRSPTISLLPTADTSLDCSTVSSLGNRPTLGVGDGKHVAMQFDLDAISGRSIGRATLEFIQVHRDGAAAVGVYSLDVPIASARAPDFEGISARFPRDKGIDRDPDVVFATGFDSPFWRSDWSYVSVGSHAEAIERDDERRFEPLIGSALRVTIPKGANLGLDMGFNFLDKLGGEPEEIYFRYYIRFGDDWTPMVDGGKLPGPAGTYGRAGWGGRKANAREGWSMRGFFLRALSPANPLHGRVVIGTYAYHAAGEDFFGDEWDWNLATQVLERNRWYCLEQHLKVNNPGARDGVLHAWIDGVTAFDKRDVYLRDTPLIKIEKIWMNVYHGGTAKAATDLDLYIDNVVIAHRRIGCLSH